MENKFILVNADTDSITINKKDNTSFSIDERINLLKQLNSLFPENIKWTDDGYYKTVIVFRAKNYVLDDGKKIKYKGSAIKATQKEPALAIFIKEVIDLILQNKDNFNELYMTYVNEILSLQDITRWCFKKTLTSTVFSSDRTNETKVVEAIQGSEYKEGDKVYLFFKPDESLCLQENFNGEYNIVRLLGKLHDTASIFETVLDTKTLFPNYSLVKNQKLLGLRN